jgi:hypothetical protein
MHVTRSARRILKRATAVALVAIAGGGAVAGTAHAWTDPTLPDLVATGPTDVFLPTPEITSLYASVRNDLGRFVFAPASTATIKYQPVTRVVLPGGYAYVTTPGSTAITATGTVGIIWPGTSERFVANSDRTPGGYNRITVCADSSNAIRERSELNNCFTEYKNVIPVYNG